MNFLILQKRLFYKYGYCRQSDIDKDARDSVSAIRGPFILYDGREGGTGGIFSGGECEKEWLSTGGNPKI